MTCSADQSNEKYLYFLALFVFTDEALSWKNSEMAKVSAQKL